MSRQDKIGRNQACPCQSGKKFKHCCGALRPSPQVRPAPPKLKAAMRQVRNAQEARERLRAKQQGHGRPIISLEADGYRTVAIGNRMMWSRRWRFFTDFLLDYLKDQLGREWGVEQIKARSSHPVFRWMRRLGEASQQNHAVSGGVLTAVEVGWLTALFGLGYALYLIAHHDQLAPSLLVRLRSPVTFKAAYYETLVAAAFAKAGYAIEWAELGATGKPTPELWATARSGVKYAVEAKCKDGWKSALDPTDQAFVDELRQWIRDQIYKASKKRLENPIYWFELSIPILFDEAQWHAVRKIVVATITGAEGLTVAGAPAAPAYVFVTNNVQLVNDDAVGSPQTTMLEGFKHPDLKSNIYLPLEAAFESRDRHRDVTWVFDCLKEVQRVPTTFDGHPSELLDAQGAPLASFKIGEALEVVGDDGKTLAGVVEDVCSMGDRAFVYLVNDGRRYSAIVPLTPEEIAAVEIHGDAIFGKPEGPHRNLEGDPLRLYDWLLEVYTAYPRDVLLRQMAENHPGQSFDHMANKALATSLARGYAAGAHRMQEARRAPDGAEPHAWHR
ncbi:YecA family protein [Caulobacter endophyticus]|uniref:YecA family protein n=1 Tax=Caulobacter endophyticus TaxID=2172652 RepID=UPI0018EEA467|nr:SEC-C domain-containing protein [Caulobacter endophyticus]